MYSSDSKLGTVSFMQLESRSAVPQASQSPSKASARTSNSTDSTDAEVKNHCRLRDHPHFFHFFVFFDSRPGSCQRICGIIIANKIFSSAKAALICFFRAGGKNRRHLGCCNIVRSRASAEQNKGITLSQNLSSKLLKEWSSRSTLQDRWS